MTSAGPARSPEPSDESWALPVIFVKVAWLDRALSRTAPSSARSIGPTDLDYHEGELAIAIGRDGAIGRATASPTTSPPAICRAASRSGSGKGADTFCPYGPWITTADEVPDAETCGCGPGSTTSCARNSSTGDLLFGCDELIRFISQTCTLRPGDLILTGTPSGVGMAFDPPRYLAPGDRMRIAIERLGEIEQTVVAANRPVPQAAAS